ncbi:MAG: Unknown protein [uncultured Campylobacterales bacterium]|uniref:EAL domain-containing protein n=1 Tax=uncultured Campylobacterales bacterium TaxID=352960 RepID=A0A6S6TIJ5_9BACT|nr:MAG: Unknown protein [uncultured Campylobacterales bacterium]
MGRVIDISKRILDIFLSPLEDIGTTEGLSEKNLRSVLENRGVSDFLLYRYYEDLGDVGLYTLSNGRKGFIFRMFPPAFLGRATEEQFESFFSSMSIDGAVVQFLTFSSQNIENQIDEFEAIHNEPSNIRRDYALKEVIKNRATNLKKWTKESMFRGADFRLRDLVNLVSVLFPEDMEEEDIIAQFDIIKANMGKLYLQNFSANSLVILLREFFHAEKTASEWSSRFDQRKMINHQIVSGGVKVQTSHKEHKKGFVINDTNYVTTLTTKEFPVKMSLETFNEMFFDRLGKDIQPPIYGPFIASLTIVFDGVEKAQEEALAKLRHDMKELKKLPSKVTDSDPVLKERLQEVFTQINEITINGEVPLRSMWTLSIFDTDRRKLGQSVSNIKNNFRLYNWKLVEEKFGNIALFSTLFSFPLQYHKQVDEHLKRFNTLFKSNDSAIVPAITDNKGMGAKHLPYFGRTGQIQWFDPYSSGSNYNIAAMGYSGSGKSYTFADFITLSLAMGYKIRVIDSLPSYQRLSNLIGGQYIDFSDEKPICVNFFSKILVKRDPKTGDVIYDETEYGQRYPVIAEEDISAIIPIVGMMCGVNIVASGSESATDINTGTKTRYLAARFEEAIRESFRSRGYDAGMKEIQDYLIEIFDQERHIGNKEQASILQDIIVALAPFSDPKGAYFSFFNGVNNVEFSLDFAVVEITRLEEKGALYPIVLMVVANQIVNEFFGDEDRSKALILDEFWKFIDNIIVMTFIEELARKIRKKNGILVTITQSIADYFRNERAISLYENCNWKWMLKQPASSIERAAQSSRLSINPFYQKMLKTIGKRSGMYGEFAILSEDTAMFTRLKADSLSHWVYTTDPKDKKKINYIMKEHNLNDVDASKFCAYQSENEDATTQEILEATGIVAKKDAVARKKAKEERDRTILYNLNKIIKSKNPLLYFQSVYDRNEQRIMEEILIRMEIDDGTLVYPKDILAIAKHNNLLQDLERAIIRKAVKMYSTRQDQILCAINITLESFLDELMIDYLIETIVEAGCTNKVVLEVPLVKVYKEMSYDIAEKHLKILRNKGIRVVTDGVTLDTSPKKFLGFDVDYIKIDGSTVSQMIEDDTSKIFTEAIIIMAQKNKMKVSMLHIENEQIYNIAKEIGADYFQGHFLSMPEKIL